jgi:GNAT superfamily N-acetyltransferase
VSEKQADSLLRLEILHAQHDREEFSCGVEALDRYLKLQAGQDMRKRVATVYIATTDGVHVEGFYTLSPFAVRLPDLPAALVKKLPRYPMMPTMLLGRLAVSLQRWGQGVGEWLLIEALRSALAISSRAASVGVIVDAKDESARQFYLKYHFIPLPDVDDRLVLSMDKIEKLFS